MGLKRMLAGVCKKAMPLAEKIPLHPNVFTLFSLVFTLVATIFIYNGNVLVAAVFVGLAYLMDGIDGLVARARKLESALGTYFDGISDRFVDLFILLAMMKLYWPSPDFAQFALTMLLAFGVFITSFALTYAYYSGAVRKEDLGKLDSIFGRPERCIAILLALVAYAFDPQISINIVMIAAILAVIAFIERFIKTVKVNREYGMQAN